MSEKKLPTLNRVFIVGNLTKDPELRKTNSGVPVINFRIASSRRFKDSTGVWKEEVCYVGVVAWQRLAETCNDYLARGSAVFIEGELQSRSWETEEGNKRSMVEIHAHKIQFLDKRGEPSREGEGEFSGVNSGFNNEEYVSSDNTPTGVSDD
jgi:single-strand DNA-binding protein